MPSETIYVSLDNPTNDVGGFGHDYTVSVPAFYSGQGLFGPLAAIDGVGGYQHIGAWARYKLPFEAGDTIESAFLIVYSMGTSLVPSSAPWTLQIRTVAYDADNPSNPASASDAGTQSSTGATTAYVEQDVFPMSQGNSYIIGDLSTIITELISRGGWAENNYALFYFRVISPVDPNIPDIISQTNYCKWYYDRGSGSPLDPSNYPTLQVTYRPRPPMPPGQSYVDDLEIEETIYYTNPRYDYDEALTIEEDFLFDRAHGRSVEDYFDITESPNHLKIWRMSVVEILAFQETLTKDRQANRDVEDVVTFVETNYGSKPKLAFLEQSFTFIEDATTYSRTYERDLDEEFVFVETPRATTFVGSVVEAIHFFEEIGLVTNLQSYVDYTEAIVIDEDFIYNGTFGRVVDQELAIQQSYLLYRGAQAGSGGIISPTDTTTYAPSNGSGTSSSTPTVTPQSTMTLEWPVVSPTLTLTLPVPLFGNLQEIMPTRVQRPVRGGQLKTFKDPSWLTTNVLRYKFEGLTPTEVSNVVNFINQTLGLEMKLTDYEGRTWTGFIVNTSAESLQYLRACGDTIEFDFDGERND